MAYTATGERQVGYTLPVAIRKIQPAKGFPPRERLTADGFYALPDTPGERYELYDGMLVMAPPPDTGHQDAAGYIYADLLAAARTTGGHAFIAPTGVTLAEDVVFEPDVVYLSPGRVHLIEGRGVEGAPDLVVEVLSKSTRRYDEHTKLPAYLEYGVTEVWLVDQRARMLTLHRSGEPPVSVPFGEAIPSRVVDIGDASLGRLPRR